MGRQWHNTFERPYRVCTLFVHSPVWRLAASLVELNLWRLEAAR